jgi:dipeptidyl aminopeptidase/acylaminoacyl peptidase
VYEQARALKVRTQDKVFRTMIMPLWSADSRLMIYRVDTGVDAWEYVVVDAVAGSRRVAFDHARMAASLTAAGVAHVLATRLDLKGLEIVDGGAAITFNYARRLWHCVLAEGAVCELEVPKALAQKIDPAVPQVMKRSVDSDRETSITFTNRLDEVLHLFWVPREGVPVGYGSIAPGASMRQHTFVGHVFVLMGEGGEPVAQYVAVENSLDAVVDQRMSIVKIGASKPKTNQASISPDGKSLVVVRDFNLHLVEGDKLLPLTTDGSADDAYAPMLAWAGDSSVFIAHRVHLAEPHEVIYVESSPKGRVQPNVHSLNYFKAGDDLPKPRLVLVRVAERRAIVVDDELMPTPFTPDGGMVLRWATDSKECYADYNQRGHQLYRILAIDAATGATRAVVEERSKTFIDYTTKTGRQWLDATHEVIWTSERDGWCHLWLYDVLRGKPKSQITRGKWVVREVIEVDEAKRQVWFMAAGLRAGEDPYHLHLCRVNLDGSGFVRLTEGDGSHRVVFAPNHEVFIDVWSRVDALPVIEMRRSSDGQPLCELERGDASALLATGWSMPQRFVAKGRDGQTDIHGILVLPSTFDPNKKYPVVEEVYAGPHSAFVPKEFGLVSKLHELAELGFIVVKADGMGTNHRGKAFHDVCWKNIADAGFKDRIAWIKAAANSRPWMDLNRVAIFGGSAGGQSAMRALLSYNDFYSVAVADCGCHDNRMDKLWWNEQWLGWPVDVSYVRNSNVEDAALLKGALLLLVGELDTNVDPSTTLQVVGALQSAGKKFDFMPIIGSGHGSAETAYGSRLRAEFLVQHLKPDVAVDR